MIASPPFPPSAELLIRKLERFAPLPDEARQAIRALPMRLQDLSRGEVLVGQGASPDDSALIVSGMTTRYKVLPDGRRQIVGMQVPGDFTDLHSFVLRPMDHAVAAAVPSRVARVPHAAIGQMLKAQPDLARWLMWDMALDAAICREWLAAMGRRTAYQQVAHLFCEFYLRMRWADPSLEQTLDLPLSQSELGDVCGLSTVHVNRSLQSLRRDGLIVLENHRLTIQDIRALMDAANFDATYLHGLGGGTA